MKFRFLSFVLLAAAACTSAAPASNPGTPGRAAQAGIPAPPEPAEPVLATSEFRPITEMHRRTFGFSEAGVWISNEFDGGWINDAWQEGNSRFVVQLSPENLPINASAWHAFKVWSRERQSVEVDLGHWRHNTGGVDLNRDWEAFNRPETRVVRDTYTRILEAPGHELWFGVDFHSTQNDVFYTLDRSMETDPPGVTDKWLDHLRTELLHYEVNDSPSGLETPMSRNWFFGTFGAPALI